MSMQLNIRCLKVVNSITIAAIILLLVKAGFANNFAAPITPAPNGVIDLPMEHNPELPEQKSTTIFSSRLQTLWLKALDRPEADIRQRAAEAIAKASIKGMKDLGKTKPKLVDLLKKDKSLQVRISAAEALIDLDDKKAASAMIERSKKDGYEIARIAYPALAKWHIQKANALWEKQIKNKKTPRGIFLLAINSIGKVKDSSALDNLLKLATNSKNQGVIRLAAARAIGCGIGKDKVIDTAKKLSKNKNFDALLAALMLNNHQDEKAQMLLFSLADNSQSTVIAAALKSLNNIAPKKLGKRADHWLSSKDESVRKQALTSLQKQDDKKSVQLLSKRLGDTNSNLRNLARKMLVKKNEQADLHDAVLKVVEDNLKKDNNWGALEQAALLAKQIGDKSTAKRLVELLNNKRPEVRLAATAALRSFHLNSTMASLLKRAKQLTKQASSASGDKAKQIGYESAQILQAFGLADYQKADSLLRKYIPKSAPFTVDARAAAIWSLGKLHEGKLDKKLAKKLAKRMLDNNMMNPEADPVKRFSAIALGRMKAKKHLKQLKKVYSPDGQSEASYKVQMASRWAIGQITGKTPPLPKPVQSKSTGWFLEPTD